LGRRAWKERELLGVITLDEIGDGKRAELRAYRKIWPDGSSCIDIMKYCKLPDGRSVLFQPIQHIQISDKLAELCRSILKLFPPMKRGCKGTIDDGRPITTKFVFCIDCGFSYGSKECQELRKRTGANIGYRYQTEKEQNETAWWDKFMSSNDNKKVQSNRGKR